jgi:HEPN domain
LERKYLWQRKNWELLNICLREGFIEMPSAGHITACTTWRKPYSLKDVHPKTHSGAIREFGLRFVKGEEVEEYYGKALRFAKEKREKSDYDFFVVISKEETEAIIQDAEKFLGRIKRAIEEMEILAKGQ